MNLEERVAKLEAILVLLQPEGCCDADRLHPKSDRPLAGFHYVEGYGRIMSNGYAPPIRPADDVKDVSDTIPQVGVDDISADELPE